MIAPVPFRSRGLFEKRTTTGSRDAVPRLLGKTAVGVIPVPLSVPTKIAHRTSRILCIRL